MNLPILIPEVPTQRFSCHGCGDCCRDLTVPLNATDTERLDVDAWEATMGEPVTMTFRGQTYLRKRDDGRCVFLMEDERCRIHAERGADAKPLACRLYPFTFAPTPRGVRTGACFTCPSVRTSKGDAFDQYRPYLAELWRETPGKKDRPAQPRLNERRRAEAREARDLQARLITLIERPDLDLDTRLQSFAWIASALADADLDTLRDERFAALLDVLFPAAPEEVRLIAQENRPAAPRNLRLLRQAAYTRSINPTVAEIKRRGHWRLVLHQLHMSRRFAAGTGTAPSFGREWPAPLRIEHAATVQPAADFEDRVRITELITRFITMNLRSGRTWGTGYYGWSMVSGLQAAAVAMAATHWLARLHASLDDGSNDHSNGNSDGESNAKAITLDNVAAAIASVDRTWGRVRWLSSSAERLRIASLRRDDGLVRLLQAMPLLVTEDET